MRGFTVYLSLWCGYFSVSIQSFALRHLVIVTIFNTEKLLNLGIKSTRILNIN